MDTVPQSFQSIISYCVKYCKYLRQVAYILATVEHETKGSFLPIEEAYYLGSKAKEYQKKLKYYPWYGRGFVQLTWESNYKKYAKLLGIPVGDGSWAKEVDKAAFVLVHGMMTGSFSSNGKGLGVYITETVTDYLNARKTVNGKDDQDLILKLAQKWELKLRDGQVVEFNPVASSFKY
jgi:hypothetical protein